MKMSTKTLFQVACRAIRTAEKNGGACVEYSAHVALMAAVPGGSMHLSAPEYSATRTIIENAFKTAFMSSPGPAPLSLAQRLEIKRGGEIDFD